MAKIKHYQVNTLPGTLQGSAIYFVKNGATARAYVTDGAGVAHEVSPPTALAVINNLTSTSTSDALSAAQGKALNDLISANIAGVADRVRFTDVIDNLTASDANKPLSANQGKALKAMIDGLNADGHVATVAWDAASRTITVTDEDGTQNAFTIPDEVIAVEASLASTDDTKALAASQGKILDDKIAAENQWQATEW